MISDEFLNKAKGKLVHVNYISEGKPTFIEGIFDYEFFEDEPEGFIDISSDTDFVRIPMEVVRKIYLKEKK